MRSPVTKRREARTYPSRFKAGKLNPVMATVIQGGEGGMMQQTVTVQLDRAAGRIVTPVDCELSLVYVPVQAIDVLLNPAVETAGITEVLRRRLLNGEEIFGTEPEGIISQRCGIEPTPVANVREVGEYIRVGHNCAVNFLRQRRYVDATLVTHLNAVVTPAIYKATILQRMNAVLDPDDHINGTVQLSIPNMTLPVSGIGFVGASNERGAGLAVRGVNAAADYTSTTSPGAGATHMPLRDSGSGSDLGLAIKQTGDGATARPDVNAALNGVVAGGVSLVDFYNAERMDKLTRTMRQMIDANPVDGEDQVFRWAHGLEVDPGQNPFLLAERLVPFAQDFKGAMDGAAMLDEITVSDNAIQISVNVPIPTTELGGVVYAFVTVRPDEVIAHQPHPIASKGWRSINHIAEEFKLDPVPVLAREVYADVLVGDETDVMFYVGHNHLKREYINYNLSRNTDGATVENKIAVWQVAVPASVTPDNVIYPSDISQFPFMDENAEIVLCTASMQAVLNTPEFFGPTPVEKVQIIEDEDLFDEVP